jgi:1-acyl-sn-glycerol-3-phosphate acyltransferase
MSALPPSEPPIEPSPQSAGSMRLYYRCLRFAAQFIFTTYFHGRVFGLRNVPNEGPVLLACNHQSFGDPVCVTLALHREGNFMARDTLFVKPMFKRLIESLNAFPVKRGAPDVGAVKELLRRLKQGKLIVIFPEATRTRDGSISEINANSLAIARKANAAIVPTVVDGAFESWPRTQALPSPSPIYVTYAEAISAEQIRQWPIEQTAAVVSERLQNALTNSRAMRRQAFKQ